MKLYTSVLTLDDFYAIAIRLRSAHRIGDDVYLDKLERKDGRKRRHTYDFHLVSSTKEPDSGRRYPNSGQYGGPGVSLWAATYDEWGWFIAALYDADPDALTATYGTREQFHAATDHRYSDRVICKHCYRTIVKVGTYWQHFDTKSFWCLPDGVKYAEPLDLEEKK